MKRKILLSILILLIIVVLFFVLIESTFLCIENMDRKKSIFVKIGKKDQFSISYIHSIYKEPVIEEFNVDGEYIILTGVRTKSPAVMEYYGFEENKEFNKRNRGLGGVFILKKGMGEEQLIIVKDKKIALSEVGDKGERVSIKIKKISLGKQIISKLLSII